MKQHLRIVLLALATMASPPLTSALSAQELWVRGGLNFATISEDESDFGDVDSRRGISLGLGLTLPVSGALAVQLDGTFTQKGDEAGEGGAKAIGIGYVEFSSVLKAWPGPCAVWSPSVKGCRNDRLRDRVKGFAERANSVGT